MNILHISPYFPSLKANHAGGVCMGKEIEALKKWHHIYVLTFIASKYDNHLKTGHVGDYHGIKVTRFTRLLHMAVEPWMPNYFAARSSMRFSCMMIYMVKRYKIDVIHAEYASMGQYIWIKKWFPGLKFNLTEHDMTAQSYERKLKGCRGIKKIYTAHQLQQILKKEMKYCTKADYLFALNQKDKRLIAERYGREDCFVINPYYGIDDKILNRDIDDSNKVNGTICFLGQMAREENYLAAMRLIEIAGRVRAEVPQLQVYIVGNQPPETLKAMENEFVHVTGFVEDVDMYLERAQLAVFPLTLGAGIKLKVLRSLAMGTPVITGKVGAEGIDEEGEVIVLAETDEEYESQIIYFLRQDVRRREVAHEGRRFIREHIGWHTSERILMNVYRQIEERKSCGDHSYLQ